MAAPDRHPGPDEGQEILGLGEGPDVVAQNDPLDRVGRRAPPVHQARQKVGMGGVDGVGRGPGLIGNHVEGAVDGIGLHRIDEGVGDR